MKRLRYSYNRACQIITYDDVKKDIILKLGDAAGDDDKQRGEENKTGSYVR